MRFLSVWSAVRTVSTSDNVLWYGEVSCGFDVWLR